MTRSAQARAPGPGRRGPRAREVLRQWWAGRDWAPGDRAQVAIVSFSHAVQHSYVAVLGIVYPFALAEFHSSYAVLGVILGIAGLAGGLLQAMAGAVRRVRTRTLLGGQNLAMAAVSAVGALSPGIVVFGAARLAGNLVSWPQHPVGSAYLTERVPRRRGLVLAAHTAGGNLGTLVTPLPFRRLLRHLTVGRGAVDHRHRLPHHRGRVPPGLLGNGRLVRPGRAGDRGVLPGHGEAATVVPATGLKRPDVSCRRRMHSTPRFPGPPHR